MVEKKRRQRVMPQRTMIHGKEYISPDEAARLWGKSGSWMRWLAKTTFTRRVKVGSRWWLDPDEVESVLLGGYASVAAAQGKPDIDRDILAGL